MALTDKLTAIAQAIRHKTGKNNSLTLDQMPGEIAGITTGGGELPSDVHAVTFMNGNEVLWVRHVADGDNCADVLTKGLIETPTKESTVQYDYTYYGWGATDNGAADSTILQNITEDKTVYAAFKETVKKYTITYYDSDGATVLKTEQLAYGATPSYAPRKENLVFAQWSPEAAPVTGDTSYVAVWEEKVTFGSASWDKLAEVVASGKAKEYFSVGDTRTVVIDASTKFTFRIIGFDHDDLADGSGKAAISCALASKWPAFSPSAQATTYADSNLCSSLNGYGVYNFSYLPSELKQLIKPVSKKYYDSTGNIATIDIPIWSLSAVELNLYKTLDGTAYEYYANGGSARVVEEGTSNGVKYWTRSWLANGTFYQVNTYGQLTHINQSQITQTAWAHWGFCI